MGLYFGRSVGKYEAPNPNPNNFFILSWATYGNYCVLKVKYDGCTTFNGKKLLLCKRPAKEMIEKHTKSGIFDTKESLDPHLLGGNHPVIARFEPTEEGWKLARICAEELGKEKWINNE